MMLNLTESAMDIKQKEDEMMRNSRDYIENTKKDLIKLSDRKKTI